MGIASSVRYWPSSAAIVESSNDAIISTNLDGTIATWNKAAEAIFGYRPQEVIGQPVFLLAAPGREDEMPVILDQIRRGQRIQHYETVRRHKNGHQVPISLTVSPIRDSSGKVVGASKVARDITDKVRAKETLEQTIAARTASRLLYGTLSVRFVTAAGTPAESGLLNVAAPEPALTRSESTWP